MLFFLHLYGVLGCYRWPAYPTATQSVVASMGSLPPERSLDLHWNLEEKQKFWFSRKTEVLVFTEVLHMQCSSIWHDIFTSKSLLPWIRKGRPLYLLSKRKLWSSLQHLCAPRTNACSPDRMMEMTLSQTLVQLDVSSKQYSHSISTSASLNPIPPPPPLSTLHHGGNLSLPPGHHQLVHAAASGGFRTLLTVTTHNLPS